MGARAGLTADKVTEAAARLADDIGFENITVSALARHFGVKDASLYSHVKSVREIRIRVAMLAAREFGDLLSAAVAGRAGLDALRAFAHSYREYALTHPGRYAAHRMRLPPEFVAGSTAHRRIIETVSALLRGYPLAEPDTTDAVRLLRSALHGFTDLEAAGDFGHPRAVQASWERAVDALHFTLEHWASAGRPAG
jgi:AcrR family transcriptional regulator